MLKKEELAFKATVIFIVNHSMIYQIALYSEPTFNFLAFSGLAILYRKIDHTNIAVSVRSNAIILASLLFGLSTLCRSTGLLLAIFTFGLLLKKAVLKSERFFKLYKYVFYMWCCFLIMVIPFGVVVLWKPYVMHCETKLDRTDAVPQWCLDEFPNVYSFI